MTHNNSLATKLGLLALLVFASSTFAQDKPKLEIQPSAVVQKPDGKTLIEKASYLIGFNFFTNAKDRPEANMEQILEGMKAAKDGRDMSSFIIGYQMMTRMKSQGAEIDMNSLQKGMQTAADDKEIGLSEQEIQMLMTSYSKMLEEKQMKKIEAESEANIAAGEAYVKAEQAKNPKLKELSNGCFYEVLEAGTGAKPTKTDQVKIHYTGTFLNGEVFDSSLEPLDGRPPKPAEFPVAGVVPGFSQALMEMQVGAKWRVIIPGKLAYGLRGSPAGKIGPNQTLIFEISLLEILKD